MLFINKMRPEEHFSFGIWPSDQYEFKTPDLNDVSKAKIEQRKLNKKIGHLETKTLFSVFSLCYWWHKLQDLLYCWWKKKKFGEELLRCFFNRQCGLLCFFSPLLGAKTAFVVVKGCVATTDFVPSLSYCHFDWALSIKLIKKTQTKQFK